MSIDLKTTSLETRRTNFENIAAKIGDNKTPSRYQEVMFGLQPEEVFHYKPTWDPEHDIYDEKRTAIKMEDFEALLDPRQFYYGAYVFQRSKQQESQEKNYAMVEKRNLLDPLPDEIKEKIAKVIIPFRHFEWGANTNNYFIAAYGFGTPISVAATFHAMDRLGNAQYMTRIGLILGKMEPEILDKAKAEWMNDPLWQPLRKVVEDSFVLKDWFEVHLLQNLLLDTLLHHLIFEHFDEQIVASGNASFAMLTGFFTEWFSESSRWVDNTLKVAASESEHNQELFNAWVGIWLPEVKKAVTPIAEYLFEDNSQEVLDQLMEKLESRTKKIGITIQ